MEDVWAGEPRWSGGMDGLGTRRKRCERNLRIILAGDGLKGRGTGRGELRNGNWGG